MTEEGPSYRVLKFGGTSVATPERIRQVVALITDVPAPYHPVVVVSALGGVTDRLRDCINTALDRSGEHGEIVEELQERHAEAAGALVTEEELRSELNDTLADRWNDLTELLDGVYLLRECTARSRDAIISMGERLSVPLVTAALREQGIDASSVAATQLIRTDDTFGAANVNEDATWDLIERQFAASPPAEVTVVPGFIGLTDDGVITTLGSSGSDYTAALLARGLSAERVEIWTDVDGMLSADPRLVPDVFPLEEVTYREASELAYFGAEVLHPRTMRPLRDTGIPLYIKNTMNPDAPGTKVTGEVSAGSGTVKAITSLRDIALLIVEGTGMIEVHELVARMFGALARENVRVVMISQASSEQSICFAVRERQATHARHVLETTFEAELGRGDIHGVHVRPDVSIVAAVGDGMRNRPGIAGPLFTALGNSKINVLAISEGASESNLSIAIDRADTPAAVDLLHETFSRGRKRVNLFVYLHSANHEPFLARLEELARTLQGDQGVNLRLVGVTNGDRAALRTDGIPYEDALDVLQSASSRPLESVVDELGGWHVSNILFLDATHESTPAAQYSRLLENGIGVVSANQTILTGSIDRYRTLESHLQGGAVVAYRAASDLPVSVLESLRAVRGEHGSIERLEFIAGSIPRDVEEEVLAGHSFTEAVRSADGSWVEQFPHEGDLVDLLLMLGREAGFSVERADVAVEFTGPPLPVTVAGAESDTDEKWTQFLQKYQERGSRPGYGGTVRKDQMRIEVHELENTGQRRYLKPGEILVRIFTDGVESDPHVIRGPRITVHERPERLFSDLRAAVRQLG